MTSSSRKPLNYSRLTYQQMAGIVRGIREEIKRRNSIGVNIYTESIDVAIAAIEEIAGGERGNFTSESGPREPELPRSVSR